MCSNKEFIQKMVIRGEEATNIKMWWLINQFLTGEIKYEIHDTYERKGTIVMPTGAGKSGVMFKDMIWHILNTPGKIVFNISAPILKLCKQSADDFFSVISKIFPDKCANGEFKIFINSSAAEKTYKKSTRDIGNVYGFKDISVFEKDEKCRFAIVISCHDSLYKFAETVDYLNNFSTVINYLDEGHLLINLKGRRDNHKEDKFTTAEKKRFNTLDTLLKSDYLYVLSATPDKSITKLVNSKTGKGSNYHIIDISAQELIENGTILKPGVEIIEVPDGYECTPELAMRFMDRCIELEPNIDHKVLITCHPGEHIEGLESGLSKHGETPNGNKFGVYSTCARNGAKSNASDENFDDSYYDELDYSSDEDSQEFKKVKPDKFIKMVDEHKGNCFVLHIRQLRQGIDIRTLTDAILYNGATRVNDGEKTSIIQTIGRVLRPYKGERPEELYEAGKTLNDRKKFQGNVLVLVGSSDYEAIGRQTAEAIVEYYGLDGVNAFSLDPDKDYGGTGKKKTKIEGWSRGFESWMDDFDAQIEQLKVDIYKFMEDVVLPMSAWEVQMGGEFSFNDAVAQIKQKFGYAEGLIPVCSAISDHDLMKAISEVLGIFGIKSR